MNKSELNEELISKIKIKLEDSLFYMPGETIKGTINIYPAIKFIVKNNKIHLKFKLQQYEFWEYTNIEIKELKNIYKTEIAENNIEHILKEEENSNKEKNQIFGHFSMILIEKEEKMISIPFEFKIEENNIKLQPTFQFENDKYILGIRHLLTVECEEYNCVNYIGLFIGKQKNKEFLCDKNILKNYRTIVDDLKIIIKFPKQSFYFGEYVNFKLISNSIHKLKSPRSFRQILYRKIEWLGYIKNTLLDKKVYKDENVHDFKNDKIDDDNELEFLGEILGDICAPLGGGFLGGGIGGIAGSIGGGLITLGSNMLMGAFLGGFLCYVVGTFGGMEIGSIVHNYLPGKKNFSDRFISKINKGNNIVNDKVKEELQKFVYFKDNKVVGFIKFKENITPPVSGHYFKCDFNVKIIIKIPGLINYDDQTIKNKIDFYDGLEYIEKMKKLLSVNS